MSGWMTFWFEKSSPLNLGISRSIFFGLMFLYFFRVSFKEWAKVSPVFWKPHTFFRLLRVPLLGYKTIFVLEIAWKILLLTACLGLATRFTTLASFLIGIYLLGIPNCFMKIRHNYGLPIILMGILAVSKCGEGFSLDHLLFLNQQSGAVSMVSADYTWPVRMCWLVMALTLFNSGYSKIKKSGWAWARAENLSVILRGMHYWSVVEEPLVRWGLWIAERPALCWFIGVSTLIIELGYPLALIWPEMRWFLIGSSVFMFLSFRVLMGPDFITFAICQVFWIPWDRLGIRI